MRKITTLQKQTMFDKHTTDCFCSANMSHIHYCVVWARCGGAGLAAAWIDKDNLETGFESNFPIFEFSSLRKNLLEIHTRN